MNRLDAPEQEFGVQRSTLNVQTLNVESMAGRELFLLSPYRVPAQHSLMLGNEDVLAFLNGFAALWHPAVLHGATVLPTVASPYDHETPTAGHLYAVPDSPPVSLPDDWEERVLQAGAVTFRA